MSRLWITPEEMGEHGTSVYAYEACKTASFILWALSGRKYAGTSTVTEWYECVCRGSSRFSAGQVSRAGYDGQLSLFEMDYVSSGNGYVNSNDTGGCGCGGTTGRSHSRLRLRGRPVRSVSKVVSNGVTLSADQYQVVNGTMLQGAPGTSLDLCGIEVTYTYGYEPPAAGRRAARYLAIELTKSYSGADCELPERVTSVARQGVSVTVLDDQAFLDDQRTGIYAVDLFLKTVNPDKARKRARIFSPDMPSAYRVTSHVTPSVGPTDLGIVPGEDFVWALPLTGANGDLLRDDDWEPMGQISSWSGAVLFDFDPSRFEVVNDTLVLTLDASETSRMSIGGSGSWDLYAINVNDNSSVIHVMNSNVYLVGRSSAVPTV